VTETSPLTEKGARQAEAIVEATLRCLGRDGFAGTSLQRIADEAGVQKRMVLYYYGDREQLFAAAVRRLGDRLLAQVAAAVEGLEEPSDIVSAGFDRLWTNLVGDRALLVAYFGLISESVTNPDLRAATAYISDGYRRLIAQLVADARSRGRRLRMDEETLTVLITAGIQGLLLEYLERGDTPGLRDAIGEFQRWMAGMAPPA
jgi:AcrR family transcriptional regulator